MDAFFAFLDEPILLALHRLALSCGAFFTPFLRFVSLLAEHGIGPILLSLCLCFFKKTRRAGAGALLSLLLGVVCTNLILKNLVARPRPFADPTGLYYAFWQSAGAVQAGGFSFPSGHVTATAAVTVALFLFSKRKKIFWPVLLAVPLMALSRCYLMVHYPSDVLFGALSGTLAAFLSFFLLRFLQDRYPAFCRFLSPAGGREEPPKRP